MPPCNRPFSKFGVYLVTDRHQTGGRPLIDCVEAALRGGVSAVQLRERDLGTREVADLGCRLREVTRRHGAALLINDRIDLVLACDADGVHLPGTSFAIGDARSLLGPDRLIGVSTHHPDEALAAGRAGADFAVLGPVFDTPSKRAYGPPVGLGALARALESATIPIVAIGGITTPRIAEVRATGVAGVAVIRAILAAKDPEAAARSFTGHGAE